MARATDIRPVVKLRSTAGTGYTYVTRKNRRNDPDRIVLWGTSYAGGHVIAVAARDQRIAAVISMNPAVDGVATLSHLRRTCGTGYLVRSSVNALRDVVASALRRPSHMVPVVGQPGSHAVIATSGSEEAWLPVAGRT